MASGINVSIPERPLNEAEYVAVREAVRAGRDLDRWIYFGDGEVGEIADSCAAAGVDRERFLEALGYGADGELPTGKRFDSTPPWRIELDEATWLADACRTLATHREDAGEGYAGKLRELAGVCELGIDVGVRPRIGR